MLNNKEKKIKVFDIAPSSHRAEPIKDPVRSKSPEATASLKTRASNEVEIRKAPEAQAPQPVLSLSKEEEKKEILEQAEKIEITPKE